MFNAEETVSAAIRSCLNQSYKNIEVIIINDGSTDNSYRIAKSYSEKYANIKLISSMNEGVVKARELGIRNAIGEFVIFLDSDDSLPYNSVKLLHDTQQQFNSDITIGDYTENTKNNSIYRRYCNFKSSSGKDFYKWIITNKIGYLWGKLIRKNLFSDIYIPYNIKFCEDYLIMLQVSYIAKIVSKTNHSCYNYYSQNTFSASNRIKSKDEYASQFYNLCLGINHLIQMSIYDNEDKNYLKALFLYYARIFIWISGRWRNKSNNFHKTFNLYLNDKQVKIILRDTYNVYYITLLTGIFPSIFSCLYVYLLKHKYNRIR